MHNALNSASYDQNQLLHAASNSAYVAHYGTAGEWLGMGDLSNLSLVWRSKKPGYYVR